jgi:transposase-like protein
MEKCRYCSGRNLRKDGIRNGVRKWRCKEHNRSQGLEDGRIKYSGKEKSVALTLYLEGCGFRRIARILGEIYNKFYRWQTIVNWIKAFGKSLEMKVIKKEKEEEEEEEAVDIAVLELDELYTYVKEKRIESRYGLVLIGTGCVLERLK